MYEFYVVFSIKSIKLKNTIKKYINKIEKDIFTKIFLINTGIFNVTINVK